jgi:hypothetical protein
LIASVKRLLPIALALALLAPATASAGTVVPDPAARQLTALGGTLVWVSGEGPGQKLMQRGADGAVAPVAGSGDAAFYRSADLGRDAQNRLVLTYARCTTASRCTYVRDDLAGHRSAIKGLAPKRCAVSSTPAVWGSRIAYGLSCFKRSGGKRISDWARTGLYVKARGKAPRRLSTPAEARRAGARSVSDVDLRGSRVAAIYEDIYEFAVVQSVGGKGRTTVRSATTEGDGEQSTAGLTIGTGEVRLWFLTRSSYAGDPAQSVIHRVRAGCHDWQVLTAPSAMDSFDYPYADLTADAGTLYAVDPGTGLVTHAFQPQFGC